LNSQIRAIRVHPVVEICFLCKATAVFTNLSSAVDIQETAIGISSLMDTWLVLRDTSRGEAERVRTLNLLKSRGMAHDTRMRTFTLSDKGIEIHGI
jgi:circadian clock protein KaiC